MTDTTDPEGQFITERALFDAPRRVSWDWFATRLRSENQTGVSRRLVVGVTGDSL